MRELLLVAAATETSVLPHSVRLQTSFSDDESSLIEFQQEQ